MSLKVTEKIVRYLFDLKHTAMWGGQLEVSHALLSTYHVILFQLRALSHVHCVPINVHQANCSVLTIGDEYHESMPINVM